MPARAHRRGRLCGGDARQGPRQAHRRARAAGHDHGHGRPRAAAGQRQLRRDLLRLRHPQPSDLARATAEQARVLRPGGRLVVLDFFRPVRLGTRIVHAIYNRGVLPWVGWAVTGDREAYRYLPRSIGRFDSTQEYGARLQQAGFGDVRVESLTFGVASIIRATRTAG
ncbi:MAG: class I SAM-dependent methyltransferase [Nannocystaceae bacterium]